MTQPVITNQPTPAGAAPTPTITGQPIITPDAGEPTMEQLAASMSDPVAEETPSASAETPAEAPAKETIEAATEADAKPSPEEAAEVDRLERAEKAKQKAREGSRRYAETQRLLQEQAARTQQAAAEAERLRRENEAARQREAEYQQDPYAALKKRGMTDVDLAQRAMREGTPEAMAARLEQQVKEERAARQALEARLAEQTRQAQAERAQADFAAIAKNAETYPELAGYRPSAQLQAAREALAKIRSNGFPTEHFTNEMIAEAANLHIRDEWLEKKPVSAKAPAPAPKPAIAKTSGKTLTNAQAQTRTTAPASWDDLTTEQQMAHLAASLPDPT
jgi:hypothetical protein